VDFHVRLLGALRDAGRPIGAVRVPVTPLPDGPPEARVEREVVAVLSSRHPDVAFHVAPDREQGRDYYGGVCFHVYVENGGESLQLVDGGLTTWTQQLMSDHKERLFISGFGTERVLGFS